jgi:hypothetical protein
MLEHMGSYTNKTEGGGGVDAGFQASLAIVQTIM